MLVATFLVIQVGTLAAACAQNDAFHLRVLSYNIHHGEGTDGKLDLERIARVIRAAEPDLVALQEVDRGARRTGGVDQPAVLARLTKMHVVFGDNIALQGGHYGNAVLSRFPIGRHKNRALPRIDGGEQRGALEVEVDLPHDLASLVFLVTHLDHREPDRQRVASARAINELAAKRDQRLWLLAGDLNDLPDSPALTEFGKHWTRTNTDAAPTYPAHKPTRQIDYVMFRPSKRWRAVETKVLEEAVASDHRAILAVFEVIPDGS